MNQEKIGKFIAEVRKEKSLTQEQLAEQLGITKNAVSKWERGLNLPDASIMPELCRILSITLNELFSGERIPDDKYKETADNNLLRALENSIFTLKDKVDFYKKKWKKEHISKILFCLISWIVLIISLIFQNVEGYLIGTVAGLLGLLFYVLLYHQMMVYVEGNAYGKKSKISIDEFRTYMNRMNDFKEIISTFDSREEATNYLMKETGLSKHECMGAYDFAMKIDFEKHK